MSLLRKIRRLIQRKETAVKSRKHRKLFLEPLEPRLLLSADLKFAMTGTADDLTLRLDTVEGTETLKLINNEDLAILASQALSETSGVEILGSGEADILTLDFGLDGFPSLLPISFIDDFAGDSDTLEILGPGAIWNITGTDEGTVGSIKFSGIESLLGGPDNEDTFAIQDGGGVSGIIDGGAGGFDTLIVEGGTYDRVFFGATGPDSGIIELDGSFLSYTGLEPITLSATAGQIEINTDFVPQPGGTTLLPTADPRADDLVLKEDLTLGAGWITLGNVDPLSPTIESVSFQVPTDSLRIDLGGKDDKLTIESLGASFGASLLVDGNEDLDSVTVAGSLFLGDGDLSITAETILVESDATIETDGNVTFTAVAENHVTGSSSPAHIDMGAHIYVEGTINAGGSLKLEATVNNTVDLDASGASLAIESQSNAVARIGTTARINAANLVVSAVTNTDISVDITDATGGGSGIGADVVAADRGSLTLLGEDGPAKFYLWDSPSLNLGADTYVVTHGWRDGLPNIDSWMDLLNSIGKYDPGANVIFTDWNELAKNLIYPEAANDTYEIGGLLAGFLEEFDFNPATTTLIGHSLGGQVSGIAADRYRLLPGNAGTPIARVIALDPAGPFFEPTLQFPAKPESHRLDAGDADRVVALHTTKILGYDDPLADLDLYVNPDSPVQPGETNFTGNHSYAVTLLTELLQGESFSQTAGSLVGDDLDAADLFNVSLLGSADVASYDSPIEVTTLAGIEGGAQIVVGTTPISPTEPASVLVQAIDNSNLHSSITTGALSDQTVYDFVQGKIGLNRDTRAYIGDATQDVTLINAGTDAAGIVTVSAQNLGNVSGEVFSDFLEFKSTTFSRENLLAYVENADLNVEGLEVSAGSATTYTTSAEENSNTVRGFAEAYIGDSTVTAGAGGVTLSAAVESSYSALSHGEGGRMSLNDIRNDVSAYVTDSTIAVTDGSISISADNRTVLDAVSTLSASNLVFADANIFAINVANGDVEAYAENSTLTTTGSGDISIEAVNEETINARVKGEATGGSSVISPPALTFGAGMAFNAVGWDMVNILWATVEDFIGDLGAEWLEGIIPFAESIPASARAYLLDTDVDAAGGLTLHADSAPQINATVSNAAESTVSSLFGTAGGSVGGVLASNKVSSAAEAWVDYSDTYPHTPGADDVSAGGAISILASDNAGIFSNAKIVSSSITTNDGGAHLLDDAVGYLTDSDYTAENDTAQQWVSLAFGDRVRLAGEYAKGGNAGSVYQYMGTNAIVDLNSVDYSDLDFWKEVLETQLIPAGGNLTASPSISLGGLVVFNEMRSDVAAYINHATVTADAVTVQALENAVIRATADSTAESSGGSVFGTGISLAVNGTIATNVVLSAANAYIANSDVTTTGGSLVVDAKNTSQLDAETMSATTSGESSVGVVLAFNTIGWESQNLLFNSLDALLGLSETAYDYTEQETADGLASGDRVQVDTGKIYEYIGPERTGQVDLSSSEEDYGDGSQWREVTPAFGNEHPAQTQAYIVDSTIDVFGDLSVTAESAAQLNAAVSNETTSMVTAFFGASAMSASAVLASNKVSSMAKAYIDYTGAQGSVEAGGKVAVSAKDRASIDAVSGMGTTAKRTNDLGAGLLNDLVNDLKGEYQYTTKSGIAQVEFGDKVRVASDYVLPSDAVDPDQETAGKVFQYMGTEELLNLGSEDYSDYELWKELKDTNVIPGTVTFAALKGFGLDTGSGKSFYGLVVRNDVQSVVESYIDNASVDAGNTVAVTAVEGARITTDDHSIVTANSQAMGGVITTNQVQSRANAFIADSTVETTAGDVIVDAQNVSELDATATTQSRATKTVGVVVALNTIGWDASNILFQAIDALLGDDLLTDERPAETAAYIVDSTVNAHDNVSVTADSTAQLSATVGNEQVSSVANDFAIMSKLGWSGMSAGGTLASNKVSSTAEAYIDNTGDKHTVTAGGTLTVETRDEAGIDANTQVVNSSVSSNTLEAVTDILSLALPDEYQYTTASGEVEFGLEYSFDDDPNTHLILPGDGVRVGADYDSSKGDSGSVYKFIGVLDVGEKIDLGAEDYTNEARWYKLTGGADDVNDWYPNFGNLTNSDARAFGMLVVLNDVRSDVDAYIDNTTVSAGEVAVAALENASIQAWAESNVTASGGSFYGSGTVLAVTGNIVTNLVQSEADAYITYSDVTVTDTGTTGNLSVEARNTTGIDATVLTTADSGDTGVGVTLAFNTLGWESQNVLFNTVDAIIGSPEIADAFGLENPSFARAYIEDTTVDAAGDLSVTAANEARLNATVSNAANSRASALWGASGKAIGGAVAMNKVNSGAEAYIDNGGIAGPAVNVSVAGALTVSAEDNAQIYSNVKIVSSSITTNDGGVGVIAETARDFVPADYSTSEGSRSIKFGGRVRLADDYANGGNAGSVYEYMGTDATIDLSTADYSDLGYWKEVLETQLFPEGINVTESDSLAIGGLVVLNEMRSDVAAHIDHAVVAADAVTVQALENAIIHATADSTAESSGGSFATGEGQSLAVNGTIATNVVLSAADAYINKSTVTTTAGDVALEAKNTSTVDAKTLSATTSGAQGVGVTLAFNTIGWKAQNILFNTIDALIGDPAVADAFGNQQPARVQAYILDSTVDSVGAIILSAVSEATINATVTNETTSAAYAFTGAESLAVGAVLASNMVNSKATAYIDSTGDRRSIDARGGGVAITAQDNATIIANSKLAAISSSTNDAGLSLLTQFADNVLGEYQFTDRSGVRDLETGDQVRLDDVDYSTTDEPAEVVQGDRVQIEFNLPGIANEGEVYEYIGSTPLTGAGPAGVDLDGQNFSDQTHWKKINATPGGVYQFRGGAEEDVNLAGEDYNNGSRWIEVISTDPRELIPGVSFNISDSDSMAFGGLVVRNDARSEVASTINKATVHAAGDVDLRALETATILAQDTSTVTSSGGSTFGGGTSLAVNGVIATNLVLSSAEAAITNSSVTTTNGGTVELDAQNTSMIDAEITSVIESNGTSVGVVLAFNTIGWKAQNFLFNTVDALVGTDIGSEDAASVKAYTDNTTLNAAGRISITAVSDADITAEIANSATTIAVSLGDNTAISVGAIITMNKVSTDVAAYIDNAGSVDAANSDIEVKAEDDTAIDATVEVSSLALAVGKEGTSVSVGLSIARNEIRNNLQAFIRNAGDVTATNGSVQVSADQSADIDATSTASAISVALGFKDNTAVSGGGATAVNLILGKNNAFIEDSAVSATGTALGTGEVRLSAENESSIDAVVQASAIAGAAGFSGSTPAVAIGFSLARNLIGWSEYGGKDSNEIKAYVSDSGDADTTSISASRGVTVTATSQSTIDATVEATAVAIAASTGTAVSVSAAGLWTDNRIATDIHAYIDGASFVDVASGSVTVSASDESTIAADAQAVAVAASLSGGTAVPISIGLSLAHNTIDNDVAAAIAHAGSVTTNGGDVVVKAEDKSSISASSVAVAVSAGISAKTGVALSGGGAESTNVILTRTNAYIETSAIGLSSEKVGKVDIDATSSSQIDALIGAVAASVSFGGTTGVGVALGIGVARNFIGWDPRGTTVTADYVSNDNPAQLANGRKVLVVSGPMAGEVFEYIGPTLTDGDSNTDGIQAVDLSVQSYQDKSAWRQVSLGESPAQIQARILDSSIQASGALTLDAVASETIDAIVVAGAVALSGGGTTGVGVSGAGVYTENKIRTLVDASINGDGANAASDGITAAGVGLNAWDSSVINAVAGAASLAGSIGGTTGVSVAIGLSLAFNEVSNEVSAHISNADEGVFTAPGGDIRISAASQGSDLFDLNLTGLLSAANLDNAAEAEEDDPDIGGNQATLDAIFDKTVLEALRAAMNTQLVAQGLDPLALYNTVATASMYKTTDTDDDGFPLEVDLREGTTVELAAGYANGGTAGRVYRYIGADRDEVYLAGENYLNPFNWLLVEPLKLTILEEGQRWSLVAPDGQTFVLERSGNTLNVGRDTINAISAAAAFAASFGGTAGVSVSGAGAVAQNVVLTKVNAFVDASRLGSSVSKVDDVDIDARSDSTISSTVVAAALAIGGGGTAGVGVSIGIGVAQNFIGWQPGESTPTPAEVQAYLKNTSVRSTGAITQDAVADQTINSTVVAGSVAVGLGGTAGIGVAGSGVWSENWIGVDVMAYIDGDGTDGILADSVTLTALDTSSIDAFAGAASLAASVGGTAGVSVAIGVSLAKNVIASQVGTYIANADDTVRTEAGGIRLLASESATIEAVSAAASIAAGFGGTAGIAISGAGAEATNVILTGTNAYVEGSTLSSAGNIDIDASNTSSIDATIFSASVSLAIGGTVGVGASIGAALATNLIGFTEAGARPGAEVQAYIENSSIIDADAVTLDALSDLSIDATVFAGAVAVAGGQVGVAISGAGASSRNRMAADVRAYIDGDGGSGITADSLAIHAKDTSLVDADTGAAAVSASFGAVGVSASVGVAIAENEIDNRVEAYIKNADNLTTTAGGVSVTADEAATIVSLTAAASASISISIGGAFAVGITESTNTLTTAVSAYIEDSGAVSSAGGVLVDANDTSIVSAEILNVALSAGLFSLSVGVALVDNTIGNDVSAGITQANVTAGGAGDISVTASSNPTITSESTVGAVAFGLGGSGAGGSSETTINGTTQAYINGGSLTAEGNDVIVSAASTSHAAPVIQGLSVGLASVSVMTSDATIAGQTRAWAGGQTAITADAFDLLATDASMATPSTVIAGGGVFSISVTDSLIDISRETVSEIASGADINMGSGQLNLTAVSNTFGGSEASSTTVSAIDIAVLSVDSSVGNTTRSEIQSGATVRSSGGTVSVSAVADNRADAKVKSIGVGIGLRAGVSKPSAEVTATTEAFTLGSIIGRNPGERAATVTVTATADDRATAGSDASGGGLVSVGIADVDAKTTSTVRAGGGGMILASGNVTIQAISTTDADASSKSASGGAVDVTDLEAAASANPNVSAIIGDGAVIDHQFGTTDVLIILPVEAIRTRYFAHFGGPDEMPAEIAPDFASLN